MLRIINFSLKPLKSVILCGLSLSTMFISGQTDTNIIQDMYTPDIPGCIYYENEFRGRFSVPAPAEVQAKMQNDTPCANIVVTYNGFTPEAEAAFQYAVDLWALSIESTQTITVEATFAPLQSGTLGFAGSGFVTLNPAVVPGAIANTFYGIPLAEKMADANINGASPDISASFNSNVPWYFGTDANPPNNQFDLVTVVLHELGHGMGFIGFGNVDNGQGSVRLGSPPRPAIFDNFIETGSGISIISLPDPSIQLGLALTSGDLFCNSANATAGNGGVLNEMFAPSTFDPGSSYSHWDETAFPSGGSNSLMTPQLGPGEAIHVIGANTSGLFEDLGWTLCEALSTDEFDTVDMQVSPNPFSSELTIRLPDNSSALYLIKLIDLNGRTVVEDRQEANNGRIQLTELNRLNKAFYFLELTDVSSGTTVIKKLVKN